MSKQLFAVNFREKFVLLIALAICWASLSGTDIFKQIKNVSNRKHREGKSLQTCLWFDFLLDRKIGISHHKRISIDHHISASGNLFKDESVENWYSNRKQSCCFRDC